MIILPSHFAGEEDSDLVCLARLLLADLDTSLDCIIVTC